MRKYLMGFHSLEVKFFLCQGNNDIKLLNKYVQVPTAQIYLSCPWLVGDLASSVSAQPAVKPLTVLTGIQLRELRLSDSTPDEFRANFVIWFSWQPKPGQNWSADKVNFTNAIGDEAIKVAIWTKPDPQLPRQRFQAMIYEGKFKAFNRYEAYPADKHLLAIRIVCPKASCGEVNICQ